MYGSLYNPNSKIIVRTTVSFFLIWNLPRSRLAPIMTKQAYYRPRIVCSSQRKTGWPDSLDWNGENFTASIFIVIITYNDQDKQRNY